MSQLQKLWIVAEIPEGFAAGRDLASRASTRQPERARTRTAATIPIFRTALLRRDMRIYLLSGGPIAITMSAGSANPKRG